jgi:hypothetical protein
MANRSLADALAESAAGPLLARVALAQQVSRTLADIVSTLAPDFDVNDASACNLREAVLLLNARSPAQAAKLRQGIPGMLRRLHQTGAQVTEIRVRVQPARMSYPERANDLPQVSPRGESTPVDGPESSRPPGPPTAVAGLQTLARTLAHDLPDSPLRRAAARLEAAVERSARAANPAPPAGRAPQRKP